MPRFRKHRNVRRRKFNSRRKGVARRRASGLGILARAKKTALKGNTYRASGQKLVSELAKVGQRLAAIASKKNINSK